VVLFEVEILFDDEHTDVPLDEFIDQCDHLGGAPSQATEFGHNQGIGVRQFGPSQFGPFTRLHLLTIYLGRPCPPDPCCTPALQLIR